MQIRHAEDGDISQIIELLKLSLGESLMGKSEAFWRWKHEANPFGKSPVLIAVDGKKLVGVRAFMQWNWQIGGRAIRAVRAVDTATHPQYQGKGIFKKLTLKLLEQCKAEGIDFIYNTPNKSSLPGYLKMGWKKNGRLRLMVTPVLARISEDVRVDPYHGQTAFPLPVVYDSQKLETPKSPSFLKWRYGMNPNISYFQIKTEHGHGIYRIKPGKLLTEMRFVEFRWDGKGKEELRALVLNVARSHNANFISWAGFKMPLVGIRLPIGPMVTINVLNPEISNDLQHWSPTLGDMEVF